MKRSLYFLIVVLLALLLAPMGQIGAQNPCGVCTPKDTTASALVALKARMGSMDKSQNAKISALQASRSRMQKDIEVLANKLVDLNSRSTTDVSVTNQLVRNTSELARQKAELSRIENELSVLSRQLFDTKAKAREQVNEDTKHKTTGMSTGDKWLIGSTVAVVTGSLVYLAIKKWGGSEVHTSSSSYSCSGYCR